MPLEIFHRQDDLSRTENRFRSLEYPHTPQQRLAIATAANLKYSHGLQALHHCMYGRENLRVRLPRHTLHRRKRVVEMNMEATQEMITDSEIQILRLCLNRRPGY